MNLHRALWLLLGLMLTSGRAADSIGGLSSESQRLLQEVKAKGKTPAASPAPNHALPVRPVPPPPPKAVAASPAPSTPFALPYKPVQRADGRHLVALDIGHTVEQRGSTSARGEGEVYFNQRIVRQLADRLDHSSVVAPIVINPDGARIGLVDRARQAAAAGAELFLSIHHDSVADRYIEKWKPVPDGPQRKFCDRFKGFGVFVSMKNREPERSLAFARLLGAAMQSTGFVFSPHHAEAIRQENRPIIDRAHGVYQYDDLLVLKNAPMPAALLECGVIVHREEELSMKDPATQTRIVEAAASAIEGYFAPR